MTPKIRQTLYLLGTMATSVVTLLAVWRGIDSSTATALGNTITALLGPRRAAAGNPRRPAHRPGAAVTAAAYTLFRLWQGVVFFAVTLAEKVLPIRWAFDFRTSSSRQNCDSAVTVTV